MLVSQYSSDDCIFLYKNVHPYATDVVGYVVFRQRTLARMRT